MVHGFDNEIFGTRSKGIVKSEKVWCSLEETKNCPSVWELQESSHGSLQIIEVCK